MKKGIFYGISVGPGDPELMTVKAIKTAESCPVVAAPKTGGGDTIALEILGQAVPLDGKKVIDIGFLMTRNRDELQKSHEAAATVIAGELSAGNDVAMPNLGDISVFSTFSYIAEILERQGFETAMIPGVTSFCASAAKLGVSLTTMDLPLHIIPAGGFPLDAALSLPGRKVLMKAGKSLPKVKAALKDKGLYDKAMLVENCGLPGEKVCRSLDDADEDTGYFATIIIKE